MLMIFNKLIDIDKFILNEVIELMYDLQVMHIFIFFIDVFFDFQKNDELHQQFFDFVIKDNFLTIVSFFFLFKREQVMVGDDSGQNVPDQLIIREDHVIRG